MVYQKKIKPDHTNEQSNINGTPIYLAPEIIKYYNVEKEEGIYNYNYSVDVYSFAILMYQVVLNINHSFGKIINVFKFFNTMIENQLYRPKFEQKKKPSFKNLIEKCWSESGDNVN